MTVFHKREYDVQFWVGTERAVPPWTASQWATLRTPFDAVVRAGRTPVKVHTSQIDLVAKKHARLGKLTWTPESDSRWTLKANSSRYFENLEVWAPTVAVCEREERAPDTYFDFTNLDGAGGYDWFAVVAMAHDIPEVVRRSVLNNVRLALASLYPDSWSAYGQRPWGYGWGDGFSDGMQELSDTVAFNLTRANGPFDIELLRGKWQLADPAA